MFDALLALDGQPSAWEMLGEARRALDTVWGRMESVAAETAQSPSLLGVRFYVQVHRRHVTVSGRRVVVSMDLRWRIRRNRGVHGHVSWQQIEAALQGLPPATQRYYRRINELVHDLHCMSGALKDVTLQLLRRIAGTRIDIRVSTRLWVLWLDDQLSPSNIVVYMGQQD